MDKNLTLGWMVERYQYLTSPMHAFIGVGNSSTMLSNIGLQGENLTIAVLSLNRSSLTIRLMKSIAENLPDFAGEFLIGDNGSDAIEKEKIQCAMALMPYRCRMVEFDRNYGVAGGRNRLFKEVETEWIFQLDNDTYFIKNPIEKAQRDIAQLGCHFLSMPVLNQKNKEAFVYGGHLYVENIGNSISVGGGSAYISPSVEKQDEHNPFLSTFVSGCASIFYKETFFLCDGYDEGMFVGFEDTEFSMRLFQKGYKIGTCGVASLIHDHPKPNNLNDIAYEKQRFSNTKLFEAARYFERKHGIQVWNPMVENWVNERLRELLDEEKVPSEPTKRDIIMSNKKNKILLVVDKPGWAFDNIAHQIIRNCSDVFDFQIIYLSDIDNVWAVFWAAEEFDLIHFLWRSWCADYKAGYSRDYAMRWGMNPDDFYKRYVVNKPVCTSVYDHLFLEDDFWITERLFCNEDSPVRAYSVSSAILKKIYDMDERIHMKPYGIITDGVDLQLFCPKNLKRFVSRKQDDKLIVGWAGNSMWSAEKEDFKGLHTILKPAIMELQEEGYPIELRLCDSNIKMTPHYKMPEYYAQIDLYVCASKIEGTPNPILECMACGVPFISTNVGIVSEVAGKLQSKYILEERSKKCLKEKLIEIFHQENILQELSEENLESIQKWDWVQRSREFIPMWQSVLRCCGQAFL